MEKQNNINFKGDKLRVNESKLWVAMYKSAILEFFNEAVTKEKEPYIQSVLGEMLTICKNMDWIFQSEAIMWQMLALAGGGGI